jgi:hypothetical protein
MKMKLLFTAMLAVLLAFGMTFVSCDDGSGDKDPPKIPSKYAGTWDSITGLPAYGIPGPISMVLVINSDGSGTVLLSGSVVPCTYEYSKSEGIDKLKMIIQGVGECTYDCSIPSSNLILENPVPDAGGAALATYALMSPYSRYVPPPPIEGGTPITGFNDIIGSWKATNLGFAGQVVFVINADGSGQVMFSADGTTGYLDDCTWGATGDKVTLTWGTGTAYEMSCTFDGSLNEGGQLILAEPNPASSLLAGYCPWGPFDKVTN